MKVKFLNYAQPHHLKMFSESDNNLSINSFDDVESSDNISEAVAFFLKIAGIKRDRIY